MVLRGQFDDTFGNAWEVAISNPNAINRTYIIGQENVFPDQTLDVYFSDDPVLIETNAEDTMTTIIKTSCSINLVSNEYIGDLIYSANDDVIVNVAKNGTIVFAGVVQPMTYSQPYNDLHDVFTINCVDFLTTLEYHKVSGTTAANYNTIKAVGRHVWIDDVLNILASATTYNVIGDGYKGAIFSDHSIDPYIRELCVNHQTVFGESYDDVWSNEEVLTEFLKYCNLHIVQKGLDFVIFNWETIKTKRNSWVFHYYTPPHDDIPSAKTITMSSDIWRSNTTNLSVDKVYSQVKVKCNIEDQGDVIVSPLESDDLYNLFGKKIHFADEIISWGSGITARQAFADYTRSGYTAYEALEVKQYFLEVRENRYWTMYIPDTRHIPASRMSIDVAYDTDANGNYINQYKIPYLLKTHQMLPCIFSIGYIDSKEAPEEGEEPTGKYKFNDYLYISVNGNGDDSAENHSPSDSTVGINTPMIEYKSPNGGSTYSPIDDSTNYLVFSGKLQLKPKTPQTCTYEFINSLDEDDVWDYMMREASPVDMKNTDDDAFVTRKYYDDDDNYFPHESLDFPSQKVEQNGDCEFDYSSVGDSSDRYKKLPVLECELIIGNKRLVENKMDEYGKSEFHWYTLDREPYWMDNEGNYILEDGEPVKKTTFTLGVNPSIGDAIVGKEYDLQNTVTISLNIDAEGTAIPITKDDNLSGPIIFRILGPVQNTWDVITRRHPTFFRSTKWTSDTKYILAHTENIIIRDFECKIYSSTDALDSNTAVTDSSDLIYISAVNSKSVEDKEVDFSFVTQVTQKEAKDKGLSLQPFANAMLKTGSGDDVVPLAAITNKITGEVAKAEEHYVNAYYNEYTTPKLILECDVADSDDIRFNNLFYNPNLKKTFYIIGSSYEAKNGFRHLKLKEV